MQFVTLQALNQMFTSEKQSRVEQQAFQFYEKALRVVGNVCCHATPNDMDHIAVKVSPTRPFIVMKHGIIYGVIDTEVALKK